MMKMIITIIMIIIVCSSSTCYCLTSFSSSVIIRKLNAYLHLKCDQKGFIKALFPNSFFLIWKWLISHSKLYWICENVVDESIWILKQCKAAPFHPVRLRACFQKTWASKKKKKRKKSDAWAFLISGGVHWQGSGTENTSKANVRICDFFPFLKKHCISKR